ncbi:MAG: hypothetical protein LBT31_03635 [Synergistaceae bacterium]|jgi:hypothetical protein|nr:hypothetical protein [Synergistaceae bacterium]
MAHISGLQGGAINPNAGNVIRPPTGEGQPAARPGESRQPQIANGTVVDGLVVGKDGEAYQVRIGTNLLNARSTVQLFIGQRFRAVWDSSATPPLLRLQQADLAVLSRFSGRDQQIALALLTRGLPVKEDVIWSLRQQWSQSGGDPAKLGALAELWARGMEMTEGNVALLSWYMELSPDMAMQIWKKLREKLRSRKFSSPRELLEALKDDDDPDVGNFLKAHSLAGKPARSGLDPTMLLAPAWWPIDDGENEPMMAKVSFSSDEKGDRQVWWVSFVMEGNSIGPVVGDVMTNSKALSVNIRMENESKVHVVRDNIQTLRDDLSELPLALQHIGVGVLAREERYGASNHGLDMEA